MAKRTHLRILTIGYEQATLGDFLSTLKRASVDRVLDVRELPMSRRKGFSKTALAEALAGAGIEYVHEQALGSPRALRHRLREDGDMPRFLDDFRKYLATQRGLLDAVAKDMNGRVALLCYERDYRECHRTVVANALARRTGAKVEHLIVPSR